MVTMHHVVSIFPLGLMLLGVDLVLAQNYPNKPIRIITSQVGGASDIISRLIGQGISSPLGQPVVIENQPGINSIENVVKAQPDGYIMLYNGTSLVITPLLRRTVWDSVRDFSPITITAQGPNVLAVHPSLPVKSVKELIALAKAKPGALNYGSGTIGGSSWLATELFKSMAGVNIVYVIYSKGGSGYINDLLSGEIHLGFSTPNTVLPHVKSGKLRALAITSLEPSILYAGLPTVAATGLPGYENVTIDAMWAPAGTPPTIISRLNQEIVRVLNTAEMKARLLTMGVEADGSSPEQLAAKMKSDIAKFGKLIKDAGIKIE